MVTNALHRFHNVVQFLSQPTQYIHFTDLETISGLFCASFPANSSLSQARSKKKSWPVLRSMRNICLTLRLSLRLLGTLYVPFLSRPAMQQKINMPPRPFATPEGSGCLRQYKQWERLWPSLQDLPFLQSFALWLDHNGHYNWDVVYEREILQSLSDVMPTLNSRGVKVCVNLPRLPLEITSYHNDDRYFVTKAPEFSVKRRVRLPWKCAAEGYEWTAADKFGIWSQMKRMAKSLLGTQRIEPRLVAKIGQSSMRWDTTSTVMNSTITHS